MRRLLATAILLLTVPPVAAQQGRIASDFEVAQIERQLQRSRDFLAQLSGRLNLGDVRAARNERTLARAEYERALKLAETERRDAREESDLARYATATSYAALAQAKLGSAAESFELLEESLRVAGDTAKTWNIYSSAMSVLGRSAKAIESARNAVRIATRDVEREATVDRRLDLAVYQHALAAALAAAGKKDDAERELERLTASLAAREFDTLRREAARAESFEIFSSARGDVAAYVSLFNRAHLRLAGLYEERGARELAITTYRRVLDARNDDATALSALARLEASDAERQRLYDEAFEANPFSPSLIRDYKTWLAKGGDAGTASAATTGGQMRRLLALMARQQKRAAREQLDALLARFPANETLRGLGRELDAPVAGGSSLVPSDSPTAEELRRLVEAMSSDRLSPDDLVALDGRQFTSDALFDAAAPSPAGQTVLAGGTIEGVSFRFAQPTAFAGTFDTAAALRLTYRILGTARSGDADVLLIEPQRLEASR